MLVDFFTKYLQGSLFMNLCDAIMGRKHIYMLKMGPPSTNESVGSMDEFGSITKEKK